MTENTPTPTTKKPTSFWLDFGPLLVFFVAYKWLQRSRPDEAMLMAAGIFAGVAVIALAVSWLRHRTVSGILIFSTFVIVATAALAIFFDDKRIFFIKPTFMNTLFGVAILAGVAFKKNILELILGGAFTMEMSKWNVLAVRWAIFFFAMAALNEVIWRNFSEDFWATFKVFGFMPITIIFTLTQLPFIQKHGEFSEEVRGK